MDINHCEYMGLPYFNPCIEICEKDNYKYIKANRDIQLGELLLIEHVLANSSGICRLVIEYNEYLFDQYHPRTKKFSKLASISKEEIDKMSEEKITHNCFSINENLLLTDTITKMNHSCNPNCAVFIQENYKTEGITTVFMELFAIKPIKKDSEITICYGPKTSHERDFVCDCGKSLEERNLYFSIVSKLASCFSIKNNDLIKEKIYGYLQLSSTKRILLNHYLATNGIFINHGNIAICTKEGSEIINNVVNSFMAIDPSKFNQEIKEGPLNHVKMSLFMWILGNKFFGN